jgi:hypothetical protein
MTAAEIISYHVGANTTFYGVALFRLRLQDFGELPTMAASPRRGRCTTRTWRRGTDTHSLL